jgi:hypothetical protein
MKAMNLIAVALAAFMSSACGANECIAQCINDNSCANIISADPLSPYNQCVAGC